MIQNSFKQIFKRTWLLVLALLVGFVLVGCDPVEEDLNIDLTFANTTYTVVEGETINVTPAVEKGADVGDITLVYSSADTAIATFVNGVVTGVAPGSTTIRVEVQGRTDVFAEATLTVTAYVEPTFTVTYVLNGGTNPSSNPASYKESDGAISLANATRLGYSFRGWFTNAEFTGEPVTQIAADATGNKTFYAKWLLISDYTITYHLDGGTNHASNPDGFRNTNAPIALEEPTKEGYVFLGWFDNEDFEGDAWDAIAFGVEENVELWAQWEAIEKTVTYDLDGGTNHANNPATFIIDDLPLVLGVPTKAGFVFDGWFDNEDFDGIAVLEIEDFDDIELFAKWVAAETFDIAYVLNGGTNDEANPVEYDNEFVTTLNDPTRVGYTFAGWFTNADFSGLALTEIAIGATGDMTLYAKWTAVEYEITLNKDGGEEVTAFADRDEVVAAFLADYNAWGSTSYTLETLPMGAWAGNDYHSFLYNETYRDKWEWLVSYLESTALPDAAALIRNFWVAQTASEFAGMGDSFYILTWEFRAFLQGIQYTPSQWWPTPDYSNPELNDGFWHFLTFSPIYTIEDSSALPDMVKEGFIFLGWFDNAEFTGEAVSQVAVGSTGDKEFFAKWLEIATYDVIYHLDGGTNHESNPATFVNDVHTPLLAPTKEGYHFLGWFLDEEFTGSAVTRIDRYQAADVDLYAKWMLIETFDITYELNGGTAHAEAPATFVNNVATTLPAPTRDGYNFGGWFLDAEFTGTAITSIAFGTSEDVTVFAKWNVATYNITYNLNGGYWIYPTKDDMLMEFFADVYEFIGLEEEEVPFMKYVHGADAEGNPLTSGYKGLWYSNETYRLMITNNTVSSRPSEANDELGLFIVSTEYYAKWIDLFDYLQAFVRTVNAGQNFYGDAFVGFLRFEAYVTRTTSGWNWVPNSWFTGQPNFSASLGYPQTFTMFDEDIAIDFVPSHANRFMEFRGWFLTADFSGDPVTAIAEGTFGHKTLYAKWEEVDNYEKVIDAIDALPGVEALTYEDKELVLAARANFEALSETAQAEVTNEDVLIAAEAQMVILGQMGITSEFPEFYEGVPALFTIGTIARDYEGTLVIARFTLPEGVIVEYREGEEGDWIALVDVFGPGSGFPLGDITTTFRGTFLAEGDYEILVEFVRVSDDVVLAEQTFEIEVAAAVFELVLDGIEVSEFSSREEMVNEFLDDYTAFYNAANSASLEQVTLLHLTDPGYNVSTALIGRLGNANANVTKIFSDDTFHAKWVWMLEYMMSVRTANQAEFQALINKTAPGTPAVVNYELWAFLAGRVHTTYPASSDYSIPANANGFWDLLPVQTEMVIDRDARNEFVLPVPSKDGFIFAGWFASENFNVLPTEAIAQYHLGDLAFTARWLDVEDIMAIEDVREEDLNAPVILQGIITSRIGSAAFVQDDTAGIYLYFGGNMIYDELYQVGDEVIVAGVLSAFNDALQVINFNMVLHLDADQPLPAPVEFEAVDYEELMAVQGQLVTFEGLTIESIPTIGSGAYTVKVTDGTTSLDIRVDMYIEDYEEVKALFQSLVVGQTVDFVGVPASRFRATPQLMLSSVDQVVFYPLTKVEVQAALQTMLAPNEFATSDLVLPTSVVVGGVTYPVIWSSSDPEVITSDGVVTRGEIDVTVELTAEVEYAEEDEIIFNFEVTVVAAPAVPEPELAFHFDFLTGHGTSYTTAPTDISFTNLVSGELTFSLFRVAANTVSAVSGSSRALVISPRLGDSIGEAFVVVDFGQNIDKLEFDTYFWSSAAIPLLTSYVLEVWDETEEEWVLVLDLKEELGEDLTINNFVLDDVEGSVFRFFATGGQLNGNNARVLVDNLKAYSFPIE